MGLQKRVLKFRDYDETDESPRDRRVTRRDRRRQALLIAAIEGLALDSRGQVMSPRPYVQGASDYVR